MNNYLDKIYALPEKRLEDVVSIIVEGAAALTGSQLSYFAVMNDAEDVLTMIGWSKTAMEECVMMDKPLVYKLEETGLWGDAVRERKAVITNYYELSTKPTKKGYPKGHVHVTRHMNLPVIKNGKIVAVIGVGNKESIYTPDDARLLEDFVTPAYDYVNF